MYFVIDFEIDEKCAKFKFCEFLNQFYGSK